MPRATESRSNSLPSIDERDQLIADLARIAAQTGWEPLVSAPLLLPEQRFFPDAWSPDELGVRRLALRFHRYAALDSLTVELRMFEASARPRPLESAATSPCPNRGLAVRFAGIVAGACVYDVDVDQLRDGHRVTVAMAHAAAHGFRARFAATLDGHGRDPEQWTELTAIYLGSGALTAASAPMLFALAVVVVARGLAGSDRRRLEAALEPGQARSFARAVEWLERHRPDLHERLGVPLDSESWPEPWSTEELGAPIDDRQANDDHDDDDPDDDDPDDDDPGVEPWNSHRTVTRIHPGEQKHDKALAWILSVVVGGLASPFGEGIGIVVGVCFFFVETALVRALGSDRCSDVECRHPLPRAASRCPNCDGLIARDPPPPAF